MVYAMSARHAVAVVCLQLVAHAAANVGECQIYNGTWCEAASVSPPTALLQVQTQVIRGSSQTGRMQPEDLLPVGRTLLSMDPAASAQFLVDYYDAKLVRLPVCEGTQRAAVRMSLSSTDDYLSDSFLIVFVQLVASPPAFEATVGGIRSTLEHASLGAETYWFPIDSHDGWYLGLGVGQENLKRMVANGVPVGGYVHSKEDNPGLAAAIQIPHTMQTIQLSLKGTPEFITPVFQDDCRGNAESSKHLAAWWKSTLLAANPQAASDFAVNVLGAVRIEAPYDSLAPDNCTSATWVMLPGINFELHFVKSSGFQHYPGEIDAFTQQVRSLRNITAGVFDPFMYNSLMLKVGSLDPWLERTRALGLPSLVVQVAEAEYALFLDIPENNIIIQLRSDHVGAGVSVLPEMCSQHFTA